MFAGAMFADVTAGRRAAGMIQVKAAVAGSTIFGAPASEYRYLSRQPAGVASPSGRIFGTGPAAFSGPGESPLRQNHVSEGRTV